MRRLCQMQTHNRKRLYQRARWKCLRLTRALDRGDHGAKRLQSVEDLVVSLLHEQAVRYEIVVGVGLYSLTPRQSPTQTPRLVTESKPSVEVLWTTDWKTSQSTHPRK